MAARRRAQVPGANGRPDRHQDQADRPARARRKSPASFGSHSNAAARVWNRPPLAGARRAHSRRYDAGSVTFETLATLVNATMQGLVMTALTVPDIAAHRTIAQPFGTPEAGEWSLPALGLGAIAAAFLEPDPDFTWDANRAAATREALTSPHLARSHTATRTI
jgi:hypothetical protein